jgi:eukaryotic-like serine/threonine-protein kinase
MGVVWRGRDLLLDRDVAVKEVVLTPALDEEERANACQRTLREARTAARLSHRGVVTVYDVAEEDGRPWIVMELVPSRSLESVLASDGPLTPQRAGRIGQQLLAALAAAHAAGVLHRDVKPSNVLIASEMISDTEPDARDERAVLTDFGIAQFAGDPRLTQTGMVMGSPGFTAPERIRGGVATPASDLWSLGATIYAAVEGRGPYEQRGGPITTMTAIINEDAPVAPSAGALGPVIAALLRRTPSARPTAAAAAKIFADVMPLLSDRSAGYVRIAHSSSVPVTGDVEASRAVAAAHAVAAGADAAGAVEAASSVLPAQAGRGEEAPAEAPAAAATSQDAFLAAAAGPGGPVAESMDLAELAESEASAQPFAALSAPVPVLPADLSDTPQPRFPGSAPQYSVPSLADGRSPAPVPVPVPVPVPSRRRRGYKPAIAAAAVVVAVVIGGVVALLLRHHTTATATPGPPLPPSVRAINNPSSVLPNNWGTETVPPSITGTTAGFTIGVPPGWQVTRQKLATYITSPGGARYLEIDLTPHAREDMVHEAYYIQNQVTAKGLLPGYQLTSISAVPIRGTHGAFWSFTWVNLKNGLMQVDDQLFIEPTNNGSQSYAIYYTAPLDEWRGALKVFDEMLRTFEPVPS